MVIDIDDVGVLQEDALAIPGRSRSSDKRFSVGKPAHIREYKHYGKKPKEIVVVLSKRHSND